MNKHDPARAVIQGDDMDVFKQSRLGKTEGGGRKPAVEGADNMDYMCMLLQPFLKKKKKQTMRG